MEIIRPSPVTSSNEAGLGRSSQQGRYTYDDAADLSESNGGDAPSESNDWLLQAWINLKARWKIVLAGQILSLLVTLGGAMQSTLAFQCNLSSPAFTVGLYYAGLALCLIPLYRQQRYAQHRSIPQVEEEKEEDNAQGQALEEQESPGLLLSAPATGAPNYTFLSIWSLEGPPWIYLIMATTDVYASYFTVAAFKYTTITSVSLLTSIAVPSTMIISFFCLGRRFTWLHLVGMLLCVAGVSLNVVKDYEADQDDQKNIPTNENTYPHKVRGDILAILGGFVYGVNDVMGEFAVRKLGGPMEYVGMMGFFATIICTIQALVFERDNISALWKSEGCNSEKVIWLLAAFAGFNVLGYTAGAKFLQVSEATFFNLSLQTGGLWSVLFSIVAQHIIPPLYFYVALVVTVCGVCCYEMAPSPILEERINSKQNGQRGVSRQQGLMNQVMD